MLLNSFLFLLLLLFPLIVQYVYSETKASHENDDGEQMMETDETTFEADLKNFIEHGKATKDFDMIVESVREEGFTRYPLPNDSRFAFPSLRCVACRGGLGFLITRRRMGDSRENLARSAIMICKLATSYSSEVCEGVINLNIDTVLFILDSRPNVNQKTLCAVLLQIECGELDESLNIQLDIAPSTQSRNFKLDSSIKDSTLKDIKIVHFTDIHFDPLYIVGGNANCDDPLCCRKESSTNDTNRAGYWGDYRKCDMPYHLVENAMRHIAEQHSDADFIYYTGDFVPHNVWDTTIEKNIEVMDKMYQLMKNAFGSKIIYPILGNHEAHPVNVFGPSSISNEALSSQWLYNYSASMWSYWLPDETMKTIQKNGYYTLLIKPGFRLIALNNNDCYIFNWWIHYSINDIKEQLQWLHDTLLVAERNIEKVHILAHIASGEGSCFKYWSREYRRIIERFYNIISAQFNGHSHYNEFNIFYGTNNISNPISVAWNGGSITTYFDVNPNYNVYYVNGENFQVNDYESWIFNLTEANQDSTINPRWYKQYSFKDNFNLSDLSLTSLDNLLVSMTKNRSMAKQYFQYKIKDGDPFLKAGCHDDCLRDHICEISINEVGDNRRCKEILANSFSAS